MLMRTRFSWAARRQRECSESAAAAAATASVRNFMIVSPMQFLLAVAYGKGRRFAPFSARQLAVCDELG